MTRQEPDWGIGSRFYLPNEDAAVVRAALGRLRRRPRRPVFVGGSGMALLEAARSLPRLESAVYVDVAAFQFEYFRLLLRAVECSQDPGELRSWFARTVYPELRCHQSGRGRFYDLDQILAAMQHLFGLDFFFDATAFDQARAILGRVVAVRSGIGAYLAAAPVNHDFIYLSNVPDYLVPDDLAALFAACRRHQAAVYLLATSACPDRAVLARAWQTAGYSPHEASARLDFANRGLGSPRLERSWNRPGTIHLLLPTS